MILKNFEQVVVEEYHNVIWGNTQLVNTNNCEEEFEYKYATEVERLWAFHHIVLHRLRLSTAVNLPHELRIAVF